MEASVWMWTHKQSCLSPMVYDNLQSFADFKADMHNVYIKVRKDPEQNWTKLPFIAIDDANFVVLDSWPPIFLRSYCSGDLPFYSMLLTKVKEFI